MKTLLCWILAAAAMLAGVSLAQSPTEKGPSLGSDRERLIGAWHLVSLGEAGSDGKLNSVAGLKGSLIYSRDGHMSVQIMYPDSASSLSNDYVRNGYEASFGSYEVEEARHVLTHHVQGSITRGLIGKSLSRAYQLTGDGHLIIQSTRPDEHWSVTWERD